MDRLVQIAVREFAIGTRQRLVEPGAVGEVIADQLEDMGERRIDAPFEIAAFCGDRATVALIGLRACRGCRCAGGQADRRDADQAEHVSFGEGIASRLRGAERAEDDKGEGAADLQRPPGMEGEVHFALATKRRRAGGRRAKRKRFLDEGERRHEHAIFRRCAAAAIMAAMARRLAMARWRDGKRPIHSNRRKVAPIDYFFIIHHLDDISMICYFRLRRQRPIAAASGVTPTRRDVSSWRGVETLEAAPRRGALLTCRIRARSPSILPIRSPPCCR